MSVINPSAILDFFVSGAILDFIPLFFQINPNPKKPLPYLRYPTLTLTLALASYTYVTTLNLNPNPNLFYLRHINTLSHSAEPLGPRPCGKRQEGYLNYSPRFVLVNDISDNNCNKTVYNANSLYIGTIFLPVFGQRLYYSKGIVAASLFNFEFSQLFCQVFNPLG